MAHSYIIFLSPIVGFSVNVLIQVLSCRYVKGFRILKSIFLGFSIGFFLLLAPVAFLPQMGWAEFVSICIVNIVTYGCLEYCYFNFINLGVTARRIRLLWDLSEAQAGLSYDEILKQYNATTMIHERLKRLLDSGQVIEKNGRYFIGKPVMSFISEIILFLKLLIIGKKSEFD